MNPAADPLRPSHPASPYPKGDDGESIARRIQRGIVFRQKDGGEGTGGCYTSFLRGVLLSHNLILLLCTVGLASGFLASFLMTYHRQTGYAVLSCLALGLVPTLVNVYSVVVRLELEKMPLNSVYVLGFLTGYLMGNKTTYFYALFYLTFVEHSIPHHN